MADQTGPRPVNALGGIAGNLVLPPVLTAIGAGVAAATTIYSGAMIGYDSSNNLVNADAAACRTVMGIARRTSDNTTTANPPTSGLAGAINNEILVGPYSCLSDGTISSTTAYGTDLYVVDNQTVGTSDQSATGAARLRAGYFVALDNNSNPIVMFGVASPSGRAFSGAGSATRQYYARAVMTTSAVASYTGTGTNIITASTNAALVAQDGVTMAVGDVILLQGGTLGSFVVTAVDTGPWVITSLGSASSKFVFERPDWWLTGATVPTGQGIDIGTEGTLFPGTHWSSWASPGCVVGTTDPALYPDRVITKLTLAASTVTLSTVPVRTTSSGVYCEFAGANGGSTSNTVGYGTIVAPTAGYVGTASIVVDALAAGMTKNSNADTSFVNTLIINR
jgi:hypothetical protein